MAASLIRTDAFLLGSIPVTALYRVSFFLQVICEKIFRSWFSPTLLGEKAGLPLQVELQRAVQECGEMDSGEDTGRRRAVRQQLRGLLMELIEEDAGSQEVQERKRCVHTALNFWTNVAHK